MSKNIQMPEEFLVNVYRLIWLLNDQEQTEEVKALCKSLEAQITAKIEAMKRRRLYTDYKTSESEAGKEEARQKYLDEIGMKESFRWSASARPSEDNNVH